MPEMPTEPGWTPPARRRVSDRLWIAVIGAVAALLAGERTWRAVTPPAEAQTDALELLRKDFTEFAIKMEHRMTEVETRQGIKK